MIPLQKLLAASLLAAVLAGCQKPSSAEQASSAQPTDEGGRNDAVTFKAGHGLSFHPTIMRNMDLKVAEVAEAPLASVFTVSLHVINGAGGFQRVALTPGVTNKTEASGWLSEEKAKRLQTGQEVELRAAGAGAGVTEKGIVKRVDKAVFATLWDFEVVVETEAPFHSGTRLQATFHAPAGDAVTTVPRSALLKTAEGWFVYAVNESFYLRTPVKVGAMNEEFAEITDGLYTGDEIVVSPVKDLWMAELQILRGGKSCTCGH
jgi:multidrug efflux pump subunit AcrA (membrane-fusion protein)